MTTALIPLDTLGATIRAHIEKGDASIEKAEQHYKSAGLHLAEAKARVKQTPGLTWPRFLLDHCQIRRARADELIMIADGRTTLADLRMKKAESVRATRERKREDLPLRSGKPLAAITEEAASPDVLPDGEVARLKAEIETLKKKLAKAEETIAEKEAQRRTQESMALIADKQARDAANRAMFAEADKERLANELAALRNDAPTEAVLAWLRKVDPDDEDREKFLRDITHLISDWFVPIHWYHDCAAELHLARGTPMPEGLAKKRGALRNA